MLMAMQCATARVAFLLRTLFFPEKSGNQPMQQHEMMIRVRYSETDAMGFLHHSNYLSYFEIGRTELFRAQGGSYRRMEELGLFFVVVRVTVKYRKPARYDDLLRLETAISRTTPAKLEHNYRIFRDQDLLTEGESTIACIDKNGQVQRIPADLVGLTTTS
jgi:acyl-CoA thioester hydrolase